MKKHTLITLSALTLAMTGCATSQPQSQTQATPINKPQIALVLGGGGTRGYAHIGAIKALEQHGIRPNLIVGTSAGAMVGAVYASGKTPAELERIALTLDETDLLDISPSKQGLIEGTALREFINKQVGNKPIEKLPTRFAAVATDAHAKTTVSFRQGDTGLAVQASSSVPKLFIAPRVPEIGGKKYIDGSQTALLPSTVAKSMGADIVIAVDVMASPIKTPTPSHTTAGISRTNSGIKAVWGDDVIELPIDKDAITKSTKDLPISIDFDKLFGMIPNNTNIPLPVNFPARLPKSKADFNDMANSIFANSMSRATPADIKATDVLIAPELSQYAVFDGTDKEKIIQAGYAATLDKISDIKKAISEQQK